MNLLDTFVSSVIYCECISDFMVSVWLKQPVYQPDQFSEIQLNWLISIQTEAVLVWNLKKKQPNKSMVYQKHFILNNDMFERVQQN